MYHRNYTIYLHKELDFLKTLVTRFHEQEYVNDLELAVAMQRTQEIYEQFLRIRLTPNEIPEAPSQRSEIVSEPEKPVTVVKEEKKTKKTIPVIEEKKPPSAAKTSILAEKISPASDFLPINETLAQQTGSDLSSKLQTAPLSTISSGIGLNDKFLFIRELFKGDKDLYDNVLKYLDAVNSLEEALDFINRNFEWDEKSETTQKFVNLLLRRHKEN